MKLSNTFRMLIWHDLLICWSISHVLRENPYWIVLDIWIPPTFPLSENHMVVIMASLRSVVYFSAATTTHINPPFAHPFWGKLRYPFSMCWCIAKKEKLSYETKIDPVIPLIGFSPWKKGTPRADGLWFHFLGVSFTIFPTKSTINLPIVSSSSTPNTFGGKVGR